MTNNYIPISDDEHEYDRIDEKSTKDKIVLYIDIMREYMWVRDDRYVHRCYVDGCSSARRTSYQHHIHMLKFKSWSECRKRVIEKKY